MSGRRDMAARHGVDRHRIRGPRAGRGGTARARVLGALAGAAVTLLALAGCTSDPLAEDYLDGGNEGFISGSGITEIPVDQRGDPISFEGETDTGDTVSRADYEGEVLVVNFWYADCAPCRVEAPDLVALDAKYDGAGADFLGVNIYNSAPRSRAFAEKFGVQYPSVLDATDQEVRLAFAGEVAPSAVPTTFVLDTRGRIAARILGQVEARSILDTIVRDVVAENG